MYRSTDDGSAVVRTGALPFDDESFADVLDEWMRRTPWLACSIATHAVVAFVLMAIPWEVFDTNDAKTIQASIEQLSEEVFEEPLLEEPEPIEQEVIEEPVLQDAEISDHNEDETDQSTTATEGDPDWILSDSPFDSDQFNSDHRHRRGRRWQVRQPLRRSSQQTCEAARWLGYRAGAEGRAATGSRSTRTRTVAGRPTTTPITARRTTSAASRATAARRCTTSG